MTKKTTHTQKMSKLSPSPPQHKPPHLSTHPLGVTHPLSILLAPLPFLAAELERAGGLQVINLDESKQLEVEWSELIWSRTLVSSNMVVMRQNLQEAECRCMSSCHRLIILLLIPPPLPSLILPHYWLTRHYCRSMIFLFSTYSPPSLLALSLWSETDNKIQPKKL